MALLTTGLIDNTPVMGVRPSSSISLWMSNDGATEATVLVKGYYQTGNNKIQYVEELVNIGSGGVVFRNYFANLDALEYWFDSSSLDVAISLWGRDSAGNLTVAHRVVAQEVEEL